jgi:tetratricopeptide (TPR) repeat protein
VPVINALESLYRKAGKDDSLATILRARIELSPEDFGAYIDLADLHVRANRTAEAEKVLAELEASPNQLPEKFLVLARAYSRYGMARRAFVLYQKLADSGQATADQRFEFCDFCLGHEEFAPEARVQADKLCQEGSLEASGYVRLSEVFGSHGKKDEAQRMLERGLAACAKRADGSENKQAVFTLNMAMSDLEHRLGRGHHAAAIGSTLKALLAAPDLHFKQLLNDRLVTLLTNYGHRQKLLYTSEEEAGDPKMFGGMHGAGIAPWVDFLNSQANSREDADLWMLLGQINETVEVDADIPGNAGGTTTAPAAARRIKTSLAQARLCYEKVIDMEFQNVEAHRALARVLADPAVDEYEKAINELEVLSLLNPVTKWGSMQAIGDLYATAGETEKAREKWQGVAAQSVSEPDLLGQVAMRMFRGGDVAAAVDFAQRTAAMSPFVFRNRAALANLLELVATMDPTANNLAKSGDELAETLKLAQTSPGMSGFVPALSRRLFDSRVALARLHFGKGDYKAAKSQYEAAAEVQKKTPWGGSEAALVDVQVQVARCIEATGDAKEAMRLYVEALKDKPRAVCWVSAGVSASGESFLKLKREGRLVEAGPPAVSKAAGAVRGTALATYELHEAIHRAVVSTAGEAYLEGASNHYRANGAADGLKVVSDQDWPPLTGRSDVTASLTENGAGEKVLETHAGGVELKKKLADVIGAAGESLWYPLVVAGGPGSEKVLLTESLEGKVYVIDARTGALQCTVALDVAAIAPPVVAGDIALVHSLQNGVVHVTAIDLKRLAIVYRSDLKAGGRTVGGLADGPMIWKNRAIYVDPQTHGTLALSIGDGSVTALDLAGNDPTPDDFRTRFRWRLGGDTLARVSNHGQVKMWRLTQ